MKNLILLSSFLIFSIFFTSCEKEPQLGVSINLSGIWLGEGYQCPIGTLHDEMIEITHNLNSGEVVATKITGDACVTEGNITFTGFFDGKLESSTEKNRFDVTFVTGSQDLPNSSTSQSTIEVINSDLLRDIALEGIVFTRE